jgi:hypothetical protein
MARVSLCCINLHGMNANVAVKVYLQAFLTLALNEDEHLASFPTEEDARYVFGRRLGGTQRRSARLSMPEMEPGFIRRSACRIITVPT